MSTDARRRHGRIVHDHKGTATVEWVDLPPDFQQDRRQLEIEDARQPVGVTHNPHMRLPEMESNRAPGQRTDLRKLSAWIKMMR